MRRLLLGAGLLLASLVAWADVPPIPALTARVTDLTATLSGDQRQHLEQQLAALKPRAARSSLCCWSRPPATIPSRSTRCVPSRNGSWARRRSTTASCCWWRRTTAPCASRSATAWKAITDVQAGRIISEQITPQFRQGNFYGGIQAGVDSLVQLIDAEKNPDSATASAPVDALPAVPEATPPLGPAGTGRRG